MRRCATCLLLDTRDCCTADCSAYVVGLHHPVPLEIRLMRHGEEKLVQLGRYVRTACALHGFVEEVVACFDVLADDLLRVELG